MFCRVLCKHGLSKYAGLKDTLVEMYTRGIDSPYLMATLIDIYEEELDNNTAEPRTLDKAIEVSFAIEGHYHKMNISPENSSIR